MPHEKMGLRAEELGLKNTQASKCSNNINSSVKRSMKSSTAAHAEVLISCVYVATRGLASMSYR